MQMYRRLCFELAFSVECFIRFWFSENADTQGRDTYNYELSEKRAEFAYDYLINKGVESAQLTKKGEGEKNQISKNKSSNGKYIWESLKYNRRVEFVVNKQGEKPLIIEQISIPKSYSIKDPKDLYSIFLALSLTEEEKEIGNVKQLNYYGTTFYSLGGYSSINTAKEKLLKIKEQGYNDSYIFFNKF